MKERRGRRRRVKERHKRQLLLLLLEANGALLVSECERVFGDFFNAHDSGFHAG